MNKNLDTGLGNEFFFLCDTKSTDRKTQNRQMDFIKTKLNRNSQ
jgi:hypothetical protein